MMLMSTESNSFPSKKSMKSDMLANTRVVLCGRWQFIGYRFMYIAYSNISIV